MTMRAARHVGGFARCEPSRCSLRSNTGHSIPGGTAMAIQQTAMKNSDTEVPDVETFETIVIGGGQAGLSVGFYGTPSVPGFADELDPRIVQMHSSEYRDPFQLRPGGVLLVGAGNSGADIAIEVSKTHRTWLSGRDKGQVPIRIESRLARFVLPILWFVASHVLTVKTPIGRKVRPHVLANGAPRIRVKADDLLAAGVERVPKTVGATDGRPVLEDGRILDVANVIWCTGFRQDFGWIDVPVFGGDEAPQHDRGVAAEPGLY